MRRSRALLFAVVLPACHRGEGSGAGGAPAAQATAAPEATSSASVAPKAPAPPPAPGSGVVALAWETPVREEARDGAKAIGHLRAGAIVAAKPESAGKNGCKDWREIAPRGFVCVDGVQATLDQGHEIARALAIRPDRTQGLPYLYGIVRKPGPVYGRIPTRAEAEKEEPGLSARMAEWLAAEGDAGASFRADLWTRGRAAPTPKELWDTGADEGLVAPFVTGKALPGNFSGLARGELVVARTKHHNGFAVLDTVASGGRRYAITTHMLAVPVDRLRPIEGSAFHGFRIPEDIDFPFAIIRREGAEALREEGKSTVVAGKLARRSVHKLTGKQKFFKKVLHFQLEDGTWVSDQVASRLDPAKKMPKWGKNGERWIDVNITKQTLVAYDGTKAVYATLVSTGEAGLGDPETSKSTKRGIFRIHTKHVAATMDSDVVGEEFELRDIPYVQYFEGGYALHAAYWHDDFGTPRSHGCINLAPADARWLFDFTAPDVPEGWHGARRSLTGSVVFVHP